MAKKMLEVHELTTKYITRQGEDVYSVDHVSLDIEEGKSLGIAGESGCGKSTLALSLMGYYFPPLHYTSGEIIIDGKNISGMDPDVVRKTVLGSEVAYIPQAAMNALNPTRKVGKFIEDVIEAHELPMDKKQIREMAEQRFAKLGLDSPFRSFPGHFSAEPRPREPVQTKRPQPVPDRDHGHSALHRQLCGDGLHPAGIQRHPRRGAAVPAGPGPEDH